MGKASAGLFGKFHGKVGEYVFDEMRGRSKQTQYVRSLDRKIGQNLEDSRPARDRMAIISRILNQIEDWYWRRFWSRSRKEKNGWNALVAPHMEAVEPNGDLGIPPIASIGERYPLPNFRALQGRVSKEIELRWNIELVGNAKKDDDIRGHWIKAEDNAEGHYAAEWKEFIGARNNGLTRFDVNLPKGTKIIVGAFAAADMSKPGRKVLSPVVFDSVNVP